jgi:hypothetical protein
MRTNCVNYHSNSLASLQQSQHRLFNIALDTDADKDKFAGLHFAEQPVNPWLIKRVKAALMQNDLPILPHHIPRKIGVAVRCKAYPVSQQCVPHLFLPFCAVNAAGNRVIAIVITGVNIGNRNHRDIPASRPGHNATNVPHNPPVVSYARLTAGQQEVFLSVDIYEDLSASCSEQLQNHFSVFLTPQFRFCKAKRRGLCLPVP